MESDWVGSRLVRILSLQVIWGTWLYDQARCHGCCHTENLQGIKLPKNSVPMKTEWKIRSVIDLLFLHNWSNTISTSWIGKVYPSESVTLWSWKPVSQPFWWMINEPSLAGAIMELSLLSCPPPSSSSSSSSDALVGSPGARHSRVMSIWVVKHCTTFTLLLIFTTPDNALNPYLIALLCYASEFNWLEIILHSLKWLSWRMFRQCCWL